MKNQAEDVAIHFLPFYRRTYRSGAAVVRKQVDLCRKGGFIWLLTEL